MLANANRLLWVIAHNNEMDICEVVGTNVRKVRQAKGWSQEQLSLETGVDRSYLSELESGKKNVGVEVLAKLANGLGVHVTEFFKDY